MQGKETMHAQHAAEIFTPLGITNAEITTANHEKLR